MQIARQCGILALGFSTSPLRVLTKKPNILFFQPLPKGGSEMNIKPLGDRVLVKPVEETEQKRGGIIIPDTAKEKPQEGVVIAVGPGKIAETGQKIPMNVKAGDKVLYGKYAGTEVKLDNEDHLIMPESDILGIIK